MARYGYYPASKLIDITGTGTLLGDNIIIGAFKELLKAAVEGMAAGTAKVIEFAILADNVTGVGTTTLTIHRHEDGEYSIDGYMEGAKYALAEFITSSVVIKAAAILIGTEVSLLGIIAIGTGVVILHSATDTLLDLNNGISPFADTLKFYDKNGKLSSGLYYPDGIDAISNNYQSAILDFIGRAQGEIVNGGKILIEDKYSGLTIVKGYTLYNGNFLDRLVSASSVSSVTDFLAVGDQKNLNSHAYKGVGDHYFFFENNNVALDIPVLINGVEQVVTVNTINGNTGRLMGTGSGKNLFFNSTGLPSTITGGSGDDLILSGVSNDTLNGGFGDDILIGGKGDDILNGGFGENIIDGGDDNDTVTYEFAYLNLYINLNNHAALSEIPGVNDTLYSIENVIGGSGNDVIYGNSSDNRLNGGGGNDVITPGGGNDIIDGSNGVDTLSYSTSNSSIIANLNTGVATEFASSGMNASTVYNIENVTGGSAIDYLTGNSLNNTLTGNGGDDTLDGAAGNDYLYGGDGSDVLVGGGDVDNLYGGAESDTLTGGGGNDIFHIDSGDGFDIITDPEAGDSIQFSSGALSGTASKLGNDIFQLGGYNLRQQGTDLVITKNASAYGSQSATGVTIQNFFTSGYDPKLSYSNIGITIPGTDTPVTNNEKSIVDLNVQAIPGDNMRYCPIVLDLNGDGIKYKSWTSTGYNVHFDIDNDGFAEGMEWLDANDGFLVRDLNGNGKIDNGSELFGEDGGTTAYYKLAQLDTNHDDKVDANDSGFSGLRIWQDLNSNGKTEAGELKTLVQANIKELSLQLTNNQYANDNTPINLLIKRA